MQFHTTHTVEEDILRQAVQLHMAALSYRSFITSFGESFLLNLYRSILELRIGFLVVALDPPRVRGFILGCFDSSRLISIILRKPLVFGPIMIPHMLRHPSSVLNALQILLYPSKLPSSVKAELVVIAVDEASRSQGVGGRMLELFDEELRSQGVLQYKVTVHEAMERSNKFYQANGFALKGKFDLLGVRWNSYVRGSARA